MKYQWIEETKTCEQLSQELGCQVKSMTKGGIIIGYEDGFDPEGNPIQVPIIKQGIELEFEQEPTEKQFAILDKRMANLKRV